LKHADALVKTGTAPCTHPHAAPGDGFVIAMVPANRPELLLFVRVHSRSRSDRFDHRGPYAATGWKSSRVPARAVLLLLLALVFNPDAVAQNVRIGVLGLFHPHQLTLQASRNDALIIHAAGQTFRSRARFTDSPLFSYFR